MQWSLVRTWAKEHGYSCSRTKIPETDNRYHYYWFKTDDENINGTSTSVSKLAFEIYNRMTNNQYVEYQKKYQEQLLHEDLDHNELSGQW